MRYEDLFDRKSNAADPKYVGDMLRSVVSHEWDEEGDQDENNTPVHVEEVHPDDDNVTC